MKKIILAAAICVAAHFALAQTNLAFAGAYNLVLLGFALRGAFSPLLCAVTMPASSLLVIAVTAAPDSQPTKLLRSPTVSASQIAFAYANNIWVVDRAGAMVAVPKLCFCPVVGDGGKFAGLFAGTPEEAWDSASELSKELHITYKDRPFHTVLSCAPPMYDELWVAGKCMYKLEPVVADGGELIIYAPHLHEISVTHGEHIRRIGYHCRDYFLKQWDKFKDEPWGTLAHSTHVHGIGTYDAATGIETPRVRVTLATGLTEAQCREINLGYRDWRTIRPEDFANREAEGVLLVPKAGERLYHLRHKPAWAGGA